MNKLRFRVISRYMQWLAYYIFLPVILFFPSGSTGQNTPATPAVLMGVITNGGNGNPIVGAKVVVNGMATYSTSGGVYSLAIEPVGTFPVNGFKAGFDTYISTPVVFQQGITTVMNIVLWETVNAPASVSVFLDTVTQVVPVSWPAPSGNYELIYDDGIQDNFTVWGSQGNMNAVKFTPAGFPVKVTGGSVNIGSAANYPVGTNPPGQFQISIYDALGAGGTPGNSLAGPIMVVPQEPGWVGFTLPLPVVLNGGAFYIVMIQGGVPPNTAGMAIDETTPQFRSYSRYVSGSSPWFPAGGNFMIRAICEGPGGPVTLSDEPFVSGLFNVFRLRQGEEQNPSVWTLLASTSSTSVPDNTWTALPCGPYRWGVKAQYTGNRWSAVTFSNILGKCWTAPVTVNLNASCLSSGPGGASIRLVNQAYPDTAYSAVADSTGVVAFQHVWKGSYQMTATKFGYDTLMQTVPVIAPAIAFDLSAIKLFFIFILVKYIFVLIF